MPRLLRKLRSQKKLKRPYLNPRRLKRLRKPKFLSHPKRSPLPPPRRRLTRLLRPSPNNVNSHLRSFLQPKRLLNLWLKSHPAIPLSIKMGMSQNRMSKWPKIQQPKTRHFTVKFKTNQHKRTRVKIKMTSLKRAQVRRNKLRLSRSQTRQTVRKGCWLRSVVTTMTMRWEMKSKLKTVLKSRRATQIRTESIEINVGDEAGWQPLPETNRVCLMFVTLI